MPYVDLNSIRLYYEEQGNGVPLILLHGAFGSLDQPDTGWNLLLPSLAEKYHCLSIEHRGHGRTTNPGGEISYVLMADDLHQFIKKIQCGPAHLAGVSDGAIIALQFSMTHPELVQSLSCVGANYFNDERCKQANNWLVDRQRVERDHPEWIEGLARIHDRNKYPGYWQNLYSQIAANIAVNPNYTTEDLQKISAPTLLMAGENDRWGNPDQMLGMRRGIPHSEMLIINHAGHLIQHTHPQIVGPVLLDFLERFSEAV
jgi:pimeloyl-ACP methyl ester carboxylesterase